MKNKVAAESLEKGEISATQLSYLLLDFIIPSTLIFTAGIEVRQDAWLSILIGVTVSLGFALLYLSLSRRFPGQSLIAINNTVWGPYAGRVISAVFLLFYLFVVLLTIDLTNIFQKSFLLNTPKLVLAFLGTGISLLLSAGGLEVLARCSQIMRILTTVIWGFLFLLGIPEIQVANFQPVFQTSVPILLKAALRVGVFVFGTGYGYMMIFPHVRPPQKASAATVKAFAIGAGYLLSGIIFTIGILGPLSEFYFFPALNASRLINVGEVFTRMEPIAGSLIWLGGFFLQSVSIYNLIMAAGEWFHLKSAATLGLPLWILISLLSTHMFASNSENLEFALKVYPLLIIPFQYFFPLLTLIVARVRRLPPRQAKKTNGTGK